MKATGAGPVVRLDQLLRHGAEGRPALTYKAETIGYGELADRVARAARGLHELGLRRGDRIAVYAEKRIETVVAVLAASAAGAVFVPVNPLARSRQVQQIVQDSGARAVITTAERHATVRASLAADDPVDVTVLIGSGAAPQADGARQAVPWEVLAAAEPAPVPDGEAVIDEDIAAIFYTSGSTGGPKGVVLSHRNLLVGAQSVAAYLGHTEQDTVLAVLPLSFDAGFSQLTTSFVAGAHVVLANYLVPSDVLRLCAQHGITALTCVPPLWLQLAAQKWPQGAADRLRYFANTGGRMPKATLERLRQVMPQAKPYLMYGLTEAFRSTYLDPAEVDSRPDSIGKAIPNAEVLVVRPDGTPCAPGEHGELVHRGALVAKGYWNDPERTAERYRPAPASGGAAANTGRPEIAVWSGDTAYRDEEGFLYFVGRQDEMIKTSGYRVSPTEIEEAVYATGLAGEAVAVGVGDERLGQHIALFVNGPCDVRLLQKTLAHELPPYMLPRQITMLDVLPRSVNGKFDRALLRKEAQP